MLIAGIDIGNTTTEVVLAEVDGRRVDPVCRARAATVGAKGSLDSLNCAAKLVSRLQEQRGLRCSHAVIAELHPVVTSVLALPEATRTDSLLRRLDSQAADTPFGTGVGVGTHVTLSQLPSSPLGMDVIVSVPASCDFEVAARLLNEAVKSGRALRGVLAEADEGVLIGNRLEGSLPVVDEVPVGQLSDGCQILMEVAQQGASVQMLSDPVALAGLIEGPPVPRTDLVELAHDLTDARSAVVIRQPHGKAEPRPDRFWVEFLDATSEKPRRVPLAQGSQGLTALVRPGSVRRVCLPESSSGCSVSEDNTIRDLFVPDLPAILRRSPLRIGSQSFSRSPVSTLSDSETAPATVEALSELLGCTVSIPCSEARAAYFGSLTTPGAPEEATVCDLGGGTIDLVSRNSSVTAAGAGELLTQSVAYCLGISRALAERVKRYRSFRVEAPQLIRHENGERGYLKMPASPDCMARLCFMGRNGPVPFSDDLSPEEWRLLRLELKSEVLGANISRCLQSTQDKPDTLLLCGGVAGDEEMLRVVGDRVSNGTVPVGRANVAGRLGSRYAVAVGLAIAFATGESVEVAGRNRTAR